MRLTSQSQLHTRNGEMPAAFEAPLSRGLATQTLLACQTPRPDRVWPNAHRPGAQEANGPVRPSGTDMKRVAAARATGCYRNPYQAPLSTPAAAASMHTGIGVNGGSHWRIHRARDKEQAAAAAATRQRMGGGAPRPSGRAAFGIQITCAFDTFTSTIANRRTCTRTGPSANSRSSDRGRRDKTPSGGCRWATALCA